VHPTVARSLNNLASSYYKQGRYKNAELSFEKAIAIYQEIFGENHSHVATGWQNLAHIYLVQSRYAQAERCYLQSLETFYQSLGDNHPNTRIVWDNFVDFLNQVVKVKQTHLLSNHPTTQYLLQQLG
jgi:tetratricopeptide (TPR) repeat protein